jgi:drug/metabolite transporter (DMT)-like permease
VRIRFDLVDGLLFVTVVIWSLHFVSVKYAVSHGFSPLVFAVLRFGVGSLLFAAITYGREGTLRIERRDAPLLLGFLVIATVVNQAAFPIGTDLTTASTMALLFGTMPILVGVIGWRLGHERPNARHWLAAGVSFAGIALVAAGAQGGVSNDLAGILVGLIAVVTWAYYTAAVAPLMSRYSPYRISAVVGLAVLLPLAAISSPQLAHEQWGSIAPLAWGAFLYSTLIGFVLTYVLWFTAIGRVGANRSSVYANLQPFLGALFAVVILSETLTLIQAIGGAVIAIAVVIARSRRAPVEIPD